MSFTKRRSVSSHRRETRPFLPRLEILEDRTVLSVLTVTSAADSGDGSLRSMIAAAQDGDHIVFDPSLQGQTITLTGGQLAITKSLDIEGLGADKLAISGNHQSRILTVSNGVALTIVGLTITDGLAAGGPGKGGAILNTGGNLTLANDILSNNEALGNTVGNTGNGNAGAISNEPSATLTVRDCLFLDNRAIGSNAALGGAITNATGSTATVIDSSFIGNQTIGGSGGSGSSIGFSRGGAIYNAIATLTVEQCTFIGNQAIAGSGNTGRGNFAVAFGGGIANTEEGNLFVDGSLFRANRAIGGSNNTVVSGSSLNDSPGTALGGGLFNGWVATVNNTTFEDNQTLGGNGNQGSGAFNWVGCGLGGGIYTASGNISGGPGLLTARNLTLRENGAVGGAGNSSGSFVGEGIGGGLDNDGSNGSTIPSGGSSVTLTDSIITGNEARGGSVAVGGSGGEARGGGLANVFGGTLTVSGSTLTGNEAGGGDGADGGNGGDGFGGSLWNDGPSMHPSNLGAPTVLTILGSTITDNEAEGGSTGVGGGNAGLGAGGGIWNAGILTVLDSNLAHNTALGRDGENGADGGDGLGGGIYVAGGTVSLLDITIRHNRAMGGDGDSGGNGGNGFGGGLYVADGTVTVAAGDISENQALGGYGDAGGTDGLGVGGGVYNLGTFQFDAAVVIGHNHASTNSDDGFGY
jgi:hypothetical protein